MSNFSDYEHLISRGTVMRLFQFSRTALHLIEYEKKRKVKILSFGDFTITLIMQINCSILLTYCCIDGYNWPLTKDTVVIRIGKRTFAFAMPGLLLGLQLPGHCQMHQVHSAVKMFKKYGHFKDIIGRNKGYPVDERDPKMFKKLRRRFLPLAHETLVELGHKPGLSRYSGKGHNSCFLRASRLSAITKLILQSMLIRTLTKSLVIMKGTNPPEAHQGRAYPLISVFTCLIDAAEYASGLFCICDDGPRFDDVRTPIRSGSREVDIGYRIWKLNEEGRLTFMSRLGSLADQEQEILTAKQKHWKEIDKREKERKEKARQEAAAAAENEEDTDQSENDDDDMATDGNDG